MFHGDHLLWVPAHPRGRRSILKGWSHVLTCTEVQPYREEDDLGRLKGTLVFYQDPLEPTGEAVYLDHARPFPKG
ncbi:hypothetical protein [Thermus scotoductus]|uniref:hypothetical protein n=1 Tax=Thermus scotoductus TaxID=37636 RepID=UPI0020A5880D|nr:hypothetical protein [Thermus scotoductus]